MREIISAGKKMTVRVIKFKAWDTSAKLMLSWEDLLKPDALSGDTVDLKIFEYERFKMLQFTGLHDKNGKEIYESDIVDCSTKFLRHIYEGYWDERCAQFRLRVNGEMQFDKTYMPDIAKLGEVIGNVWANKELLRKRKWK